MTSFLDIYIYAEHINPNMRQKLITLDLTSYELASKMSNFSGWVRQQLKEYRDPGQNRLDLDFYKGECKRQSELLKELAAGKKEWVSPHGWMACGEDE